MRAPNSLVSTEYNPVPLAKADWTWGRKMIRLYQWESFFIELQIGSRRSIKFWYSLGWSLKQKNCKYKDCERETSFFQKKKLDISQEA